MVFWRTQCFRNWIFHHQVGGTFAVEYVRSSDWVYIFQADPEQSWCLPAFHLRMEADAFSEMLCSLEYQAVDRVLKLSNPECYTSSESFTVNLKRTRWLQYLLKWMQLG
jgi:uncharacterized protein YqiB (DUF1249 family)